jgi:hypothetical protein
MKRLLIAVVVLLAIAGATGCGAPASDRAARAAKAQADAKAAADKARQENEAARAAQRLLDLWTYTSAPVDKGRQVAAQIYSTNSVDTDGQGAKGVMLVFRDHPAWGRSSYLVLQGGDFNCAGGCSVAVKVDDAAAKRMAARRPPTDEAIAMFINDWKSLWRLTEDAKQLSIEFPVKAGGTRTATYDVAGLDRSRMPGWDGR